MRQKKINSSWLNVLAALVIWQGYPALAAEIKLADGQRLAALIESYDSKGDVGIYLTSGDKKTVALRDIASIFFSGREARFIRTGDQKFLFAAGGHICGAVEELKNGNVMQLNSQSLGRHVILLRYMHGMAALAVEGRPARLAEDLMREDGIPLTVENAYLDFVLDRRGVPYAGIVETLSPTRLEFEHDEQLQQVRIDTYKLAGVRLAEATKDKSGIIDPVDVLHVAVECRDMSLIIGQIVGINPFMWNIKPNFDAKRVMDIPTSEISRVYILGGRTVFLTDLKPVRTIEETILAPPQPYQKNANSQGESMDIGGFIYRAGLGVHANSRITYKLDGKFQDFFADAGIDGRLEKEGSVIFVVIGDGRELYKSPLIRGKPAGGGLPIHASVAGVRELTLSVESTDDLDQADLANWGAARVTRQSSVPAPGSTSALAPTLAPVNKTAPAKIPELGSKPEPAKKPGQEKKQ
jgi:hypothetical protein